MLKKANILYLTYDGLTDPLGQSQILPYLVGLSKKGYAIQVISFEKEDHVKKEGKTIENLCQSNGILWTPLRYHKRPPVISTLYDLFNLWKACGKVVKDSAIGVVHCRSYLTSLIGLRLKIKYNVSFIFDMRGFWADERVEGGLWNLRNPLYKWIYRYVKEKESEFIESADEVIVLTQKAKDILQGYRKRNSVTVIPCCADTAHFSAAGITKTDQELLRAQLKIKNGEFVLSYIGSVGTWYLLDEMFDFFNVLLQHNEYYKFLIITTHAKDEVTARATQRNVDPSRLIVKTASRSEMPLYISISDSTILFIKETFSKQGSSPTKLAEALAMGVPAIANANVGDNAILFEGGKIGVILKELNAVHYHQAAKEILEFSKDSTAIREFAINKLSLEIGVNLYHTIYQKILTNQPSGNSL